MMGKNPRWTPSGIKSPLGTGMGRNIFPATGNGAGTGGGGVSGDGDGEYTPRPRPAPLPSLVARQPNQRLGPTEQLRMCQEGEIWIANQAKHQRQPIRRMGHKALFLVLV